MRRGRGQDGTEGVWAREETSGHLSDPGNDERDAVGGRARTSANAANTVATSACLPRRALGASSGRNRDADSACASMACARGTEHGAGCWAKTRVLILRWEDDEKHRNAPKAPIPVCHRVRSPRRTRFPRRPRTPERARDAFFRARAPRARATTPRGACGAYGAPRAPILSPSERQLVKPPFERLVRHPATSTPPSRPRASRCAGRPRRARRSTRRRLRHRAGSPPRRRARARPRRRRRRPRLRSRRRIRPVVTVGPRDHRRVRGILPRVLAAPSIDASPTRRRPPPPPPPPRPARRGVTFIAGVAFGAAYLALDLPGAFRRRGAIPRRRAALRVRILRRHARNDASASPLRPRAPPPHRALGTLGTLGHSRSRGAASPRPRRHPPTCSSATVARRRPRGTPSRAWMPPGASRFADPPRTRSVAWRATRSTTASCSFP